MKPYATLCVIPVALLLLFSACGEQLPGASRILSFRPLAAATEPAEVHCGQSFDISALAVNEDGGVARSADYVWVLSDTTIDFRDPDQSALDPSAFALGSVTRMTLPPEVPIDCDQGGRMYLFGLVARDLDLDALMDPATGGQALKDLLFSDTSRLMVKTLTLLPRDEADINENPVIEQVEATLPDNTVVTPLLATFPDPAVEGSVITVQDPGKKGSRTIHLKVSATDDRTGLYDLTTNWYATREFVVINPMVVTNWTFPHWQDPATATLPEEMPPDLEDALGDPNLHPVYVVARDGDEGMDWKGFFIRVTPPAAQ